MNHGMPPHLRQEMKHPEPSTWSIRLSSDRAPRAGSLSES